MYAKITREILEAFHDGELTPSESKAVQLQIDSDPEVSFLYETVRFDQALIQRSLREKTNSAVEQVNWDRFTDRVMAYTPQSTYRSEECSSREQANELSFWDTVQEFTNWFRKRPGFVLSGVAAFGFLVIVSLHYFDPGPQPIDDTVVEKIVSSSKSQVAVLNTKSPNGKSVTVIVIDDLLNDKKMRSNKKTGAKEKQKEKSP